MDNLRFIIRIALEEGLFDRPLESNESKVFAKYMNDINNMTHTEKLYYNNIKKHLNRKNFNKVNNVLHEMRSTVIGISIEYKKAMGKWSREIFEPMHWNRMDK